MDIDKNELDDAIFEGTVMIIFNAEMFEMSEEFVAISEKLREVFNSQIDIYSIDVDEYPEVAEKFGITMIPTVGIFHNSKPKVKIEGVHKLDVYTEQLRNVLQTDNK